MLLASQHFDWARFQHSPDLTHMTHLSCPVQPASAVQAVPCAGRDAEEVNGMPRDLKRRLTCSMMLLEMDCCSANQGFAYGTYQAPCLPVSCALLRRTGMMLAAFGPLGASA